MTADTSPYVEAPCSPDRASWSAADCECGPDFWRTAFAHRVRYGAPAMTFEAWLLFRLHVHHHQGLGGRS